ncbi:MAG: aminotransferase class I/II-fold pyridoxal phosphate-dependent enzyme [Defluviitaleaceae bacterium]|nr:aminotransferase class I/II-fold pyridoxal phosphate-dependent enzyme [Defluviitaleaceae bacterium]
MPGHKRNPDFLPPDLAALDFTEIPGLDVLSAPTGILRELQEYIADLYEADRSFLLVNGSSAGIVAAICTACANGAPLIAPRNAHVSMYNGLALSGARPVYILPEITADGLAGGISPEVFDNMPEGAAAFVVSPTYEGFVSDIAAIAKKVHQRGGILIVDEAHGAHFIFGKLCESDGYFPPSAISQGADIVVNSLHKTLPALSQTAVLHVNSPRVNISRLSFYINAVQTSSPSYILMAACDFMFCKLKKNPEIFKEYITRLERLRAALPGWDCQGGCQNAPTALRLSGRERIGTRAIYDIDPGKLLFTVDCALHAEEIAEIMAREFKVQMEMAKGRHILAMTSVADTDEGFERLKTAIYGLNERLFAPQKTFPQIIYFPFLSTFALPEMVLTPGEAIRRETRLVPREEAIGCISGEIIAEYPPGIALVAPGERIPAEILPLLRKKTLYQII